MSLTENLTYTQPLFSDDVPGDNVTSMSQRQLRTLKGELKNLKLIIVDCLNVNPLEEITPTLQLLAFYKCDPVYKYPSFDFIQMLLFCYWVSSYILILIYLFLHFLNV